MHLVGRLVGGALAIQLVASSSQTLFGAWGTDGDELPTFNYTMNQLTDPIATEYARTADPKGLGRDGRDHVFQFGNDRLVVVASNFGYLQVTGCKACDAGRRAPRDPPAPHIASGSALASSSPTLSVCNLGAPAVL